MKQPQEVRQIRSEKELVVGRRYFVLYKPACDAAAPELFWADLNIARAEQAHKYGKRHVWLWLKPSAKYNKTPTSVVCTPGRAVLRESNVFGPLPDEATPSFSRRRGVRGNNR